MKILSAEQMRRIDRETEAAGVPGIVLMENAGHRVLEALQRIAAPLERQRIVVFCGKGNNGGDGLVVARQLLTRIRPASLHVLLTGDPASMQGDAAANLRMFLACGGAIEQQIQPEMQAATLLVDAMLGTGLEGPPREPALFFIREWNRGFPLAKRIAIDVPSGMSSDALASHDDFCRVDACVTFTALRHCHALPPWCDACGEVTVGEIGTPTSLLRGDATLRLEQVEPSWLRFAAAPRPPGSHKGTFGHVAILGGSRGKPGAVALSGLAALRAGAGLVTVASVASAAPAIVQIAPELMTAALAETPDGFIEASALEGAAGEEILAGKHVFALGPGLGVHDDTRRFLLSFLEEVPAPKVLDADALNLLAKEPQWPGDGLLVLTPHPGEMARLVNTTTSEIQSNRLRHARELAQRRNAVVVLKGQRTLIAFPDGEIWVNPTGSPAMATAGSGDVLTGTIAAMLSQHADSPKLAIAAAVWLHGKAGEVGARVHGEQSMVASDLLSAYPEAFRSLREEIA